jgi:threonyl-tRNA synthetase
MSQNIKLKFPDGSVKEFSAGISGFEIAERISKKLAKEATGILVNGEIKSLPDPSDGTCCEKTFSRSKTGHRSTY